MPIFLAFDPFYLVISLVALAIGGWATVATRSAFSRYARVPTRAGISGAEAAAFLLRAAGIEDVRVERARGFLTDHYDPRSKVLRLSEQVHDGRSVAAFGVAAHETGHAIQHARGYAPLALRNLAVPLAGFGSNLAFPLLLIGFMLQASGLVFVGLVLFTVVVLFQVLTVPVEVNASRRAVALLQGAGLVTTPEEEQGVKTVLTAAAMTYVAAAVTSILQLLYFLARARRN